MLPHLLQGAAAREVTRLERSITRSEWEDLAVSKAGTTPALSVQQFLLRELLSLVKALRDETVSYPGQLVGAGTPPSCSS